MSTFLTLRDLEEDIKAYLGSNFNVASEGAKLGIVPASMQPPDVFTDCHISIFETQILFPPNSSRIAFIISIDNCSCCSEGANINCSTIGKDDRNGQIKARGLLIGVVLSNNLTCKGKVLNEILYYLDKALDILTYFKGNLWNCTNCDC